MPKTIQNEIVRASAGTGKTFQLSNRYLNLIVRGVDCPSILATTFTRKAAGEILDRIMQRLSAAALDDKVANELGEFIRINNLPARRCRSILAKTLHQLHRMQVGTLDSFFSRLARSFSLELGLFTDWRVINQNEYEHNLLRDEAIERLLSRGPVKELVYLLGRGEAERSISETIRQSVVHLYSIWLDSPHEAWEQIPEAKLLSEKEVLEIGRQLETISWPQAKMGTTALSDFEHFVSGDHDRFLSVGVSKKVANSETNFSRKEIPQEAVRLLQRLIEEVARIELNQIARQTRANYEVLSAYHTVFSQLKSEREIVEYDDIARGLSQFVAASSADNLNYRTDRRINHLLLDEFQDTSPLQWNAIRPFAEYVTAPVVAPPENIQAERSFFCVGDTKQAIYGWRGGEAEIFDTVDQQLSNVHDAPPLVDSFRSSPVIINAVNEFFENMQNHDNLGQNENGVDQWCQKFVRHTTQRKELSGYVTMETARDKDLVLEEAANKVAALYREIQGKTIGVLVRKNATVGTLIAMLGRLGVPASEESGNPLTDSAAVCLILSALRLADHPGNRIAWFHLQNSPLGKYFGFVGETGELLSYDTAGNATLASRLRASLLEEGYGRVIEGLANVLLPSCKPRERNRLMQMVDLTYSTDFETTLRPSDFANYIETAKVSDPTAARVQVMNIHQAKGLEFDIVVLPEIDGNLMPFTPRWVSWREQPGGPVKVVTKYMNHDLQQIAPPLIQTVFESYRQKAINEKLCWAYVALTRARRALHILVAPKENERGLPKSVSGLLRAAVARDIKPKPGVTLFQSGDSDWFKSSAGEIKATKKGEKNAVKSCLGRIMHVPDDQPIELAFNTGKRWRGLTLSSPSRLRRESTIRVADIFRLEENLPALQRGTLLHRWFQQIRWLEEPGDFEAIADQRLEEIASLMPQLLVNIEQSVASFRAALSQKEVQAVFRRDFYLNPDLAGFDASLAGELGVENGSINETGVDETSVEVFNERAFAVRLDDEILQGTVDRLVLIRRGGRVIAADVIDFKTDALVTDDANELSARVELYRPQLRSYQRAISKIYRLPEERVTLKLLFVQPAKLIELSVIAPA